jgi:hypothetical protein
MGNEVILGNDISLLDMRRRWLYILVNRGGGLRVIFGLKGI